jgi:hypothetical protein
MISEMNGEEVNAPGLDTSGALQNYRINPCATAAGKTTDLLFPETGAGKTTAGTGKTLRRRTVKNRKTRTGSRRKGRAQSASSHENWLRPPKGTFEAARILADEGYIVGKTTGPAPLFDLVGRSPEQGILVKIIRPREPVRGAARVTELYLPEILLLRSYYRSPAAYIELWIFSREVGLARYRVFDWGIANVTTVTKLFKTQPSTASTGKSSQKFHADQQTRNSPSPVGVSG